MTTSHKTKWREARMRLKNRDVMTIFNRDGTTTEVEHPFSALQALHYEQQTERNLAAELLALRADAETSQNHNVGVIDRIVEQLREAGYTGTLSEMVDEVIAKASDDYNGL